MASGQGNGHSNVRQVGDRIEVLLGELRSSASPEVSTKVEEVVGLLVELYGAGLERILEVVNEDQDVATPLLKRFTDDKFIESLLVLHGIHPVDVDTRIETALDQARPYLGSHAGGVQYLGVDEQGVAHLKLEGSCHGCPSSTVTVKLTLEQAIAEAAPEVLRVEVEGVAEAPTGPSQNLLQIQTRPGGPVDATAADAASAWLPIDAVGLLPGEKRVQVVEGMEVFICSAVGNLYAYRNACASCGASLKDAALLDEALRCSRCGTLYNVRLAGRSVHSSDSSVVHLDPLPLLQDQHEWKVAIPPGARSVVRS
ncbi:MAG TPA: NifU family protein [Actinomycetota bacterium]|nr:NifU family protein [Actinomycetota bacterium]